MNGTAALADHLDARTDAVIRLWRETVESGGDVPRAEALSPQDFIDHVPDLLDRLAERLRGHPSVAAAEGRKHGRLRWRQGYGINEIVAELGHLRTALTRATFAYARAQDFDPETLEAALSAIHDVLDGATAEAARHFHQVAAAGVERARAAAEAERSKLRAILDHLPAAVWVVDAEGTVREVNREAERLLGVGAEEVVGRLNAHAPGPGRAERRPDGTPLPTDERPIVRALRGEAVAQEEVVKTIDGRPRTVAVSAAPLRTAEGLLAGALAVVQDITPRKRVEEQLRRQLSFTAAITTNMGEGLLAVDRDGHVTFLNPAAERILGWSQDELLGRVAHDVIHARRPDGSPYPWEQCPVAGVLGTGATLRGDDAFTRQDGSTFAAAYTASPILSGEAVVGAVLSFHDISERKRLEASLIASESQFRGIAEQSPVLIWRAGVDGRCDYCNRTWCDFRGRTPEQEREDGWSEGVHPEDLAGYRDAIRGALGRPGPFELTFRLLRHDGVYRWVHARGAPYHGLSGEPLGLLVSGVDITERVELEAALDEQRRLAEEASRHKSRLLSALSHDARTPLNAVVLAAELLEMHVRPGDDPEVGECLRTIRHSVGNVLDLLGDLLNLTKIDAGVQPAEVTRFELGPVLEESIASIETQARVKGLDVRLEPGTLEGAALETDRSKLKQILCNLLSNALRYTDRGHIRVSGARSEDEVRIAVEDTGIGIDPADQKVIFDEFATLANARRQAGEGTGLGLAICRRLASLLKGEITLQSAPGAGSTFTLVLPASVLSASLPAAEAPGAAAPDGQGSGPIVVAEDHLTSRQTLAKVLRRMGYRVLEAGNGRDALALVRQERPLAVLMDINMPVMDGVDATRALRAAPETRDLPIFALTGDVSVVNQRRIGEAGVDGYLEKPVTWDALRQALASIAR